MAKQKNKDAEARSDESLDDIIFGRDEERESDDSNDTQMFLGEAPDMTPPPTKPDMTPPPARPEKTESDMQVQRVRLRREFERPKAKISDPDFRDEIRSAYNSKSKEKLVKWANERFGANLRPELFDATLRNISRRATRHERRVLSVINALISAIEQ